MTPPLWQKVKRLEQIQDENIRGYIQEINDVATESAETTKQDTNKTRYKYMKQDIIDNVIAKNHTAEQPLQDNPSSQGAN